MTKMRHGKMTHWSKGGKVKKYADGSPGGVEASEDIAGYGGQEKAVEEKSEPKKEPTFKSFKEAYAWHRKNTGEGKTFDYNGKKILIKDKATPNESAPSRPLSQKLGEDYAATDKMLRNQPKGTSAEATAALTKLRDNAKATYEKAAASEKSGTSMVKLKNGGSVSARQTAKSHGKAWTC
jgi:hypothetical protein